MLQLRNLHHLVTLARRLNFARAAEDLGITQSALSRSIQALERELGMRLFDRDRIGVSPTPQGRLAVERAAVLLADADDLERQLARSAKAEAGHVRFGMTPMPARALLPPVLAERLGTAPEVTNDVVVRDAHALWAQLVAGDIEFFITNEGFVFEAAMPRVETLGHFPISLFVRAGHPLLTGDCPGMRFPVVRASWSGLPLPADIQDRMLGPANVVEDFGALAAITIASDAIWFSSTYSLLAELAAGQLCELPRPDGDDPREVRILMYSLERRSQSPWARSLKQLLRRQIALLASNAQTPGTP